MEHSYVGSFCKKLIFYGEELLPSDPTPPPGGPPFVGCPRLLVQYIRSYPPYLEVVSSVCNLRMRHAGKLHNGELHDFYCSPSIIRMSK
jgi:hypothetical protein